MKPVSPLHFYFDFISPYGYFASLRVDDMAARYGRTVEWHPMLLGVSVMKVMGLKPLLDTPLKGPYTINDVRRYARLHSIKLTRPPGAAPMNPLTCGRVFAWAKRHHPQLAVNLARTMLRAYWEDDADFSDPQSLASLPTAISASKGIAGGIDWVQAAQSPEAAQLLRAEVDASLKAGVFGSPTVMVDGELFWGIDKFEQIDHWLETGGW
jgi:2-hydroxychromene-2-carboxylate isomerase